MNQDRVNGNGSVDAGRLRRQMLGEFLRELVREKGRMEAAEMLGVNYRTLVKAEESGELTGRMSDALERLLLSVDSSDEPNQDGQGGQSERLDRMEGKMRALANEVQDGLEEMRAAVAGNAKDGRTHAGEHGRAEDEAQAQDGDQGAGWSETKAAPPVAGLRSSRPAKLRRLDPEIVTVAPAEDDVEVYGAAWPLVEEWRALRAGHANQGRSLSWLVAEERQLRLELAMLEEHGLTLPPETQPLRGFGRKGQTSWRWTALHDTRRALARRSRWRLVRRVCTLGLWWK